MTVDPVNLAFSVGFALGMATMLAVVVRAARNARRETCRHAWGRRYDARTGRFVWACARCATRSPAVLPGPERIDPH